MDSGTDTPLPLLDHGALAQLISDTSAEVTAMIISASIKDMDMLRALVADNAQSPGIAQLKNTAHKCKSAAAYCGAARLAQLCQDIESACISEDFQQIATLAEQGRVAIPATQAVLQEWIGKNS